MKSNAPWSVKGIERDARETAKQAARREGMTVGEWLNQMIYSQAENGGAVSGGEVEGLKLRDIVTAIEHLRNRVAEAESKHAAAISELSRNVGGFVERVQRLERVKPAEGSYQDIASRLEKLERAGGADRQRIEALKALEKAVAQVAVQFSNAQRTTLNRLDSAEAQLQEFAARIDQVGAGATAEPAELGALKSAIEALAGRVSKAERIAEEAANLKSEAAASADPEFVERTGARLRVLGDEIKRGGDQIRAMEGAIEKLSGQIEAAEKRSADGVQKVAETIADIRTQLMNERADNGGSEIEEKLNAARRETDARLEKLQRSLEEMDERFEALRSAGALAAATVASEQDEKDHDLSDEIEDALSDVPAVEPSAASNPSSPNVVESEADDIAEEIEEAVAAIEAEAEALSEPETDPFAFSDEIEEDVESDADDFSFQLDDETADADGADEDEEDITVSEDDENGGGDQLKKDAQSLLAEVRNALSGEGLAGAAASREGDDEDDIAAMFADDDDDIEDEQAPNTASLAADMAPAPSDEAEKTAASGKPAENMIQVARRRAREAAERTASGEDDRPRRSQLTAKQRAILAARARQKRTAETGADALKAEPESPSPIAAAPAAEDDDDNGGGGRFSKFAAALSSARSRIGRKSDNEDEDNDDAPAQGPALEAEPVTLDEAESAQGNADRSAFESLQSTASARPLTIALGLAIILAIAALAYLVKDLAFKPANPAAQPAAKTERPAAADPAGQEEQPLATIPDAPALDPKDLYSASMAALSSADNDEEAMAAIAELQDAAALGFPPAQLQLGELYKTGQGVEQDLGQARVWFRRAANGGNVLAMHRIGVMTARGDGGPADSLEAIAWFERAANYGLVDSQYNLGAIYHPSEEGGASVQDAAKAYYWYSLAARNGDEQAQPLAAGVGVALSAEERADIEARVAAWTAKPADETANATAVTQ